MNFSRRRLVLGLTALTLFLSSPLPGRSVVFTPLPGNVLNPERGLMAFTKLEDGSLGAIDGLRSSGHTLVWGLIDLEPWRTAPLPNARLQELRRSFDRSRTNGLKLIVRILYTEAEDSPDTTLAWQETHLEQLAPIFMENNDIILCYQAGGIGAWGEWYYSTTGLDNPTDRKALLDAMFDLLPAQAFIQVRTPMYKRDYEMFPDTEVERLNRVGHFNDCFMANETNFGTYDTEPSIEFWKSIVATDSHFVPVGGETCVEDPISDCPAPVEEMETLGWTFLNSQYNVAVLDKWRSQGCFDEVEQRLGYRFVLKSAEVPDAIQPGKPFSVTVTVRNEGFAPLYKPRPLMLQLRSGGRTFEWPATAVDPRSWGPGETEHSFTVTQTAPVLLTASEASVALQLPDPSPTLTLRPDYAIRFANASVWEAGTGSNVLATGIPIQRVESSMLILHGAE